MGLTPTQETAGGSATHTPPGATVIFLNFHFPAFNPLSRGQQTLSVKGHITNNFDLGGCTFSDSTTQLSPSSIHSHRRNENTWPQLCSRRIAHLSSPITLQPHSLLLSVSGTFQAYSLLLFLFCGQFCSRYQHRPGSFPTSVCPFIVINLERFP